MNKEFDAIKMIRNIRNKSSQSYFANKEKWLKQLSQLQGKEINPLHPPKGGQQSETQASKSV